MMAIFGLIPRSVWLGLGAALSLSMGIWYVHHDGYKAGRAVGQKMFDDAMKAAQVQHDSQQSMVEVFTTPRNAALDKKIDQLKAQFAELIKVKPPGKTVAADCKADDERVAWANESRK